MKDITLIVFANYKFESGHEGCSTFHLRLKYDETPGGYLQAFTRALEDSKKFINSPVLNNPISPHNSMIFTNVTVIKEFDGWFEDTQNS
jgi:hypothetical protein